MTSRGTNVDPDQFPAGLAWWDKVRSLAIMSEESYRAIEKRAGWKTNTLIISLNKKANVRIEKAMKLADALGVPVRWLFDDSQGWDDRPIHEHTPPAHNYATNAARMIAVMQYLLSIVGGDRHAAIALDLMREAIGLPDTHAANPTESNTDPSPESNSATVAPSKPDATFTADDMAALIDRIALRVMSIGVATMTPPDDRANGMTAAEIRETGKRRKAARKQAATNAKGRSPR